MRKKKSNKKNNNGITPSPSESAKKKNNNQLTAAADSNVTTTISNNTSIDTTTATASTATIIPANESRATNDDNDDNLLSKSLTTSEEKTTSSDENSPSENKTTSSESTSESSEGEKKLLTTSKSSSNSNLRTDRKISELITVTLPMQQQAPPPPTVASAPQLPESTQHLPAETQLLPPPPPPVQLRKQNNNENRVEKCQSMLVTSSTTTTTAPNSCSSTGLKNSQIEGAKVVFKSSSLKALVRIPSLKEMEKLKQETASPVNKQPSTGATKQASFTPDPHIQQILIDLMNLQKLQDKQKKSSQTKKSASSSVRNEAEKSANKPNGSTIKASGQNYKKVEPTPNNTKKLVVQVLRDLIQLYKSDLPDNKKSKPPPTQILTPPPPSRQTPVEIKIRKQDDKIIIKTSEPVIINTTPDIKVHKHEEIIPLHAMPPKAIPTSIIKSELKKKPTLVKNDVNASILKASSTSSISGGAIVNPVKKVRYLGIVDADPEEYVRMYKDELRNPDELPEFVKSVKTPHNLKLAAEIPKRTYELEGDLEAFKHVNLEKVGMTEYREFFSSVGIATKPTQSGCELTKVIDPKLIEQVESLFKTLDTNNDGFIEVHDAERLLLKLNSAYGRNYGETESKAFFSYLAANKNQKLLDLEGFKKAFNCDY